MVDQAEQEAGFWGQKVIHCVCHTDCVTGSADIGLLTNFPTRGLPKAALVLTNARHE